MKMRIAIHQTYRAERRIVLQIDAATHEDACEMLTDGRIDVPAFDDPGWTEIRTLEHEEYRLA